MEISQYKSMAKENLAGNWFLAARITLFSSVISFLLPELLAEIPKCGEILSDFSFIILNPLVFGMLISFFKIFNNEKTSDFEFIINAFSNFTRAWKIFLYTLWKMIVWIVLIALSIIIFLSSFLTASSSIRILGITLFVISLILYIYKQFSFTLAMCISCDDPTISATDAVMQSKELMQDHVWKFILLNLSFLGWILLAAIPFGMGLFWVIPYMQFSKINFYKDLKNNT